MAAIDEVTISDRTITGRLKAPEGRKTALVATRVEPELAQRFEKFDVRYTRVVDNTFLRDLMSWIVPGLVFVGLWYFVIRRMADRQGMGGAGGFLSIGKNRAKALHADRHRCHLRRRGRSTRRAPNSPRWSTSSTPRSSTAGWGPTFPAACCWSGRPAPARPCSPRPWPARRRCRSSPSRAASSSSCSSAWAPHECATCSSRRASRAPAIIFIDELDALGRARGAFGHLGGNDEKEQTLNQLLAEMGRLRHLGRPDLPGRDNRPEILDPALLRAGCFDRQVPVDRPDRKGRINILKVHVRKVARLEHRHVARRGGGPHAGVQRRPIPRPTWSTRPRSPPRAGKAIR